MRIEADQTPEACNDLFCRPRRCRGPTRLLDPFQRRRARREELQDLDGPEQRFYLAG